jgi:hypothetical protein
MQMAVMEKGFLVHPLHPHVPAGIPVLMLMGLVLATRHGWPPFWPYMRAV